MLFLVSYKAMGEMVQTYIDLDVFSLSILSSLAEF